jgi:hypothetical protein
MAYSSILAGEASSVLSTVSDFVDNNSLSDALEVSFRFIAIKKKTSTWSHELEKIMIFLIDVGIKLNKHHYILEGMTNYRNLSNSQINSLEFVFAHYLSSLEESFQQAKSQASNFEKIMEEINCEDEPQMFYFNIMNTEKANENELCKRVWRSIVQANSFILDLTFKNAKFEDIYVKYGANILKKLYENKAYADFKKTCTLLKTHQEVLIESGKNEKVLVFKDLKNFSSNKKLFNLRIHQLEICKKLELNQECLQILEDINTLMNTCKYTSVHYIEYFSHLADLFLKGNYFFFHSLSLYQLFIHLKLQENSKEALEEIVTKVVLAVLSVNNKSHEFSLSQNMSEKYQKLIMTKKDLNDLYFEMEHWVQMFCSKEIKELFEVFIGRTDIYDFANDVQKIFNSIKNENVHYIEKIKENCILVVLKLLGNFFINLPFQELKEFTVFMDWEEVKKIILVNKFDKTLNLYLDVANEMLIFRNKELKTSLVLKSYDNYIDSLQQVSSILNYKLTKKQADVQTLAKVIDCKLSEEEKVKKRNKIQSILCKEKELIKENKPVEKEKNVNTEENKIEEKERIKRLRLNELVDQKMIEFKKDKVARILKTFPDITVLNKKLSSFTDMEINQIELDLLMNYEKAIKDKRRKTEIKQLKTHYLEFYLTQKQLASRYCKKIEEQAIEEKSTSSKYLEEIQRTKAKKEEMKQTILNAVDFITKYKRISEERQKSEYKEACEVFQQEVTDHYRSVLFEEAKKKYDELVKKQEATEKKEMFANKMGRGIFGTFAQSDNSGKQFPPKDLQRGKDFLKPEVQKLEGKGTGFVEKPKQEVSQGLSGKGTAFNEKPALAQRGGFGNPSFGLSRMTNSNQETIVLERGKGRLEKPQGEPGSNFQKEDNFSNKKLDNPPSSSNVQPMGLVKKGEGIKKETEQNSNTQKKETKDSKKEPSIVLSRNK